MKVRFTALIVLIIIGVLLLVGVLLSGCRAYWDTDTEYTKVGVISGYEIGNEFNQVLFFSDGSTLLIDRAIELDIGSKYLITYYLWGTSTDGDGAVVKVKSIELEGKE